MTLSSEQATRSNDMTTEFFRNTFIIPEDNFGRFEETFAKLSRKATRIGLPTPSYTVVREDTVELEDGTITIDRTVVVDGVELNIPGYRFVAVLQHEENGNILRRVPGTDDIVLPERFRTVRPWCDHCRAERRRNDTFVLQSVENGEFLQVGRNCLQDFIGTEDPIAIAEWYETLSSKLAECESDDDGFGGSGRREGSYMSTPFFLSHVAAMVREHGWVSRSKADIEIGRPATADRAMSNVYDQKMQVRCRQTGRPIWTDPTDDDAAVAQAAIDWFRNDVVPHSDRVAKSEYLYNLSVAIGDANPELPDVFNRRNTGLVASLVSLYKRETQKAEERKVQKAASKHIGTIAKREVFRLVLTGIHESEGMYGVTYICRFVEGDGNIVVWFASNPPDMTVGEAYNIKATVKSHGDFHGVAQTVIARGTLV
jgi:hypothetical protein